MPIINELVVLFVIKVDAIIGRWQPDTTLTVRHNVVDVVTTKAAFCLRLLEMAESFSGKMVAINAARLCGNPQTAAFVNAKPLYIA